jgi:hypothetical protein
VIDVKTLFQMLRSVDAPNIQCYLSLEPGGFVATWRFYAGNEQREYSELLDYDSLEDHATPQRYISHVVVGAQREIRALVDAVRERQKE